MKIIFNHYLIMFASIVMICLSSIAIFNWLVDPYWIYRNVEIDGVNKVKPLFRTHISMAKAHLVNKIKPQGIILGSSRSGYGLDPEHSGWSTSSVYNLSLPGTSIYELMRYFQHATADNSVKEVVLALDFFMFNGQREYKTDFEEKRLKVDKDGKHNIMEIVYDIPETLFSIDSLWASIKTLRSQNNTNSYLANGQRNWTSYASRIKKVDGYRNMFHLVEKEYLVDHWWFSSCHRYDFIETDTNKSTLRYLKTIISSAYKNNIKLHVIISPNHARFLEVIRAADLWEVYEQWKRMLVSLNESESINSGKAAFKIWDFTGYDAYNSEQVPLKIEPNRVMKWFWEPSHYKAELGTILLNRVFELDKHSDEVYSSYGVVLSSENIERHLEKIRSDRLVYINLHQDDVLEIKNLAEETENWRIKEKCKQLIKNGIQR